MDNKNITRTGTTCIGLKYKDGIVLASDRRTTAGYIYSDKSIKIHKLAKRVAATHSGTVSDAQFHKRIIHSEIKLKELRAEREITVKEVAMIANTIQYKNIRTPSTIEPIVGYLIGGYDVTGPRLFDIGPDGTLMESDSYAANGSGSIFVKSYLENEYKENLSEKEAVALVEKALKSAMNIDNHSGGGIVMFIIDKDGIKEINKKVIKNELVNEK